MQTNIWWQKANRWLSGNGGGRRNKLPTEHKKTSGVDGNVWYLAYSDGLMSLCIWQNSTNYVFKKCTAYFVNYIAIKLWKTQEYYLTTKLGGTFFCIWHCMKAEKNKDNETVLVMQTSQQIISMPYNMMSISINIYN